MADPFIAEIRLFAGNFAPRGWARCDGQLIAISGNEALFSLVGTIYGGDGRTTFGLPDLRGRIPIHYGSGPGLTPRSIGENGGAETVTLITQQIPPHSHNVVADSRPASSTDPANNFLAESAALSEYNPGASVNGTMKSTAVSLTGGGQSHDNRIPFQVVTFIIALEGIYPSRN